jgi:hypothetical protein
MAEFMNKIVIIIAPIIMVFGATTSFSATISAIQQPGQAPVMRDKVAIARELAKSEFDKPIYQFVSLAIKDKNPIIARCNTYTGSARIIKNWQYEKVAELDNLPQSNFFCALIPDGENGWLFIRIDRITGRSWKFENQIWKSIPE